MSRQPAEKTDSPQGYRSADPQAAIRCVTLTGSTARNTCSLFAQALAQRKIFFQHRAQLVLQFYFIQGLSLGGRGRVVVVDNGFLLAIVDK